MIHYVLLCLGGDTATTEDAHYEALWGIAYTGYMNCPLNAHLLLSQLCFGWTYLWTKLNEIVTKLDTLPVGVIPLNVN